MYTIDASVWINGYDATEPGHDISRQFRDELRARYLPVVLPTLVLTEVAGSLSRTRGDVARALAFVEALRRLPHITLITLTTARARQAAELAAQHRLRGADAVYAAVALHAGTTLVTLDREQRERLVGVLPVQTPAEALAQLSAR
jgi:predicted nucleic acid-binding protein